MKKQASLWMALVMILQILGIANVPIIATEVKNLDNKIAQAYYEVAYNSCDGKILEEKYLQEENTHSYSGLLQGELIDFDKNGIPELVLLRKEFVPIEKRYLVHSLQGIVLEVYTYTEQGVKQILKINSNEDLPLGLAMDTMVSIRKLKDEYVVVRGHEAVYSSDITIWKLEKDKFIEDIQYIREDSTSTWQECSTKKLLAEKDSIEMDKWYREGKNDEVISVSGFEETVRIKRNNSNARDLLSVLEASKMPILEFDDITEAFKGDSIKLNQLLTDTSWLEHYYAVWLGNASRENPYDVQTAKIEEILEIAFLHGDIQRGDSISQSVTAGENGYVTQKISKEVVQELMLEVFGRIFEMEEGRTYSSKCYHGGAEESYVLQGDFVIRKKYDGGMGREVSYRSEINRIYDAGEGLYIVVLDAFFLEAGVEIEDKFSGYFTMLVQEVEGEKENRYVPLRLQRLPEMTKEMVQGYKVQALESSNIKLEYKNEKNLQDILVSLEKSVKGSSGTINSRGLAEIYEFITYHITNSSSVAAPNKKGSIRITNEIIQKGIDNGQEIREGLETWLAKQQIVLNKPVTTSVKIDVQDIDWEKPITVIFEKLDEQIIEKIGFVQIILGDGQHTLKLDKMALEELKDASIRIKRVGVNAYDLEFLKEDKLQESISNYIYITLPAQGELATIEATYKGYTENWGGQNSYDNTAIGFNTRYSGLYKSVATPVVIKDIEVVPTQQQEAVNFMVSKGFFTLEEGKFNPYAKLNRYDFNLALVKMFFALDPEAKTAFKDMDENNPYYIYVASAELIDIVKGFEDQTFRGETNVTKEQVLAFCSRTLIDKLGLSYPEDAEGLLGFVDKNSISEWARKSVALSVREALIPQGGMLFSATEITRIEAAEILYNLFNQLYTIPPQILEIQEQATNTEEENKWNIVGLVGVVGIVGLSGIGYVAYKKRRKK